MMLKIQKRQLLTLAAFTSLGLAAPLLFVTEEEPGGDDYAT